MFQRFKELITFNAFNPQKEDPSFPLIKRFQRGSLAFIAWNIQGFEVCIVSISKKGKITFERSSKSEIKESASAENSLVETLRLIKQKDVVITIMEKLEVFPFEAKLTESDPSIQELLDDDPRRILGTLYESDRKYLCLNGLEGNIQYIMSYKKAVLNKLLQICDEAGKSVVRLGCPFYSILFNFSELKEEFHLIIYLKEILLVAHKATMGWGDLSFKNGVMASKVMEVILELFPDGVGENSKFALITDTNEELRGELRKVFNGEVNSLFKDTSMAPIEAMIRY